MGLELSPPPLFEEFEITGIVDVPEHIHVIAAGEYLGDGLHG